MTGRRSIRRPVSLSGIALHCGRRTTVSLLPAPVGHGIAFARTDLAPSPPVAAVAENVIRTDRSTTLGAGTHTVQTVEHVLAAVGAHALDDLRIEVEGPEPPIFDGSARPFFDAIQDAGISIHGGSPGRCRPPAPFTLEEGGSRYRVAPRAAGLRLQVTIEWDHPLIGKQQGSYEVSSGLFGRELAAARTFGFAAEARALQARGLIQGAGSSCAIILTESGMLGEPLRWPDEFVRHKSVDLLGDLTLTGGRLDADIMAIRPSHAGNVALAKALRANTPTGSTAMGIEEILKILPHRYPMLLVDRILEVHGTERIVGIKNVTINEPFFQGHFPGHPVMPGVLIVEAMAQVGGLLVMSAMKLPENAVVYFLSIDGVKFRRPVVPGDQLRFEVETVQIRGKTVKMKGQGLVDGKVAAEAEFMAQIVDR